jgi:hypothetical protein
MMSFRGLNSDDKAIWARPWPFVSSGGRGLELGGAFVGCNAMQ